MENAVKQNLYDVLCEIGHMTWENYEHPENRIFLSTQLHKEELRIMFEMQVLIDGWRKIDPHVLGEYRTEKREYVTVIPAIAEQAVLLLKKKNRQRLVKAFIRPHIGFWERRLDELQRWDEIEFMRSNIELQCKSIIEGTSPEW